MYPFPEGNSFPSGGREAQKWLEGRGGGGETGPECREQGSTWWEESEMGFWEVRGASVDYSPKVWA